MVLREVAFARSGRLGIEFTADGRGGPPVVRSILGDGLAAQLPPEAVPPGSALLVDLTGHKSTFAASELWAKSSAVIFVARRPG